MEIRDNSKQTKNANENKPVDNSEKRKAYRRKYMTEYMKDRKADDNFRINEDQNEYETATLIAKHLGTRNTRLLKEQN